MDIDRVDPQLRQAVRRLPVPRVQNTLIRRAARKAMRLLPAAKVPGAETQVVRNGVIRARVHRPHEAATGPGLLWIHGGGFVIGAAKQDDRLCAGTAAELGITVVSIEYRLAPEHPFPAALEDAVTAWQWVQVHGEQLGLDPRRIAVGGESAGAGIAASLSQHLLDTGGAQPIAQWLFCPMLDDRTAARRELDAVEHWVWDNAVNRFGWASYLGAAPGGPEAPPYAAAARREDLRGLPPAWICVSDIELFHDEDLDYARRLRAAGVEAMLDVVPGAPHGFENWAADTEIARALVRRGQDWLRRRLQRA